MPPKVKISEQDILDAALSLTKEKGWSFVTARDLANQLNCSTQPIFRAFQNMDDLKKKLYDRVFAEYNTYMLSGLSSRDGFEGMGMAYIRFAKEQKNLFQLLFMTDEFQINHLSEMIDDDENEEIVSLIASMSGLSHAASRQAYINIWLTTHGIASMAATNSCNFSEEEIRNILNISYSGTISYLKQKEDSNETK